MLRAGCGVVGKACAHMRSILTACLPRSARGGFCLLYDPRVAARHGAGGGSIVVASRAVDTALSTMERSKKRLENKKYEFLSTLVKY